MCMYNHLIFYMKCATVVVFSVLILIELFFSFLLFHNHTFASNPTPLAKRHICYCSFVNITIVYTHLHNTKIRLKAVIYKSITLTSCLQIDSYLPWWIYFHLHDDRSH